MALRCASTHGRHACSLAVDWLGQHAGDHRCHESHDPARPVLAAWPNAAPAAAAPGPAAAPPAPARPARLGPGAAGPRRPRVGRRAAARAARAAAPAPAPDEITDWDLLPDA